MPAPNQTHNKKIRIRFKQKTYREKQYVMLFRLHINLNFHSLSILAFKIFTEIPSAMLHNIL